MASATAEKDKTERVLTKYTVLKQVTALEDLPESDEQREFPAWEVVTSVEAAGPDAAKKSAARKIGVAEGESITLVLVPERSFQPSTFGVKVTTSIVEA